MKALSGEAVVKPGVSTSSDYVTPLQLSANSLGLIRCEGLASSDGAALSCSAVINQVLT